MNYWNDQPGVWAGAIGPQAHLTRPQATATYSVTEEITK